MAFYDSIIESSNNWEQDFETLSTGTTGWKKGLKGKHLSLHLRRGSSKQDTHRPKILQTSARKPTRELRQDISTEIATPFDEDE